ncbi:MAG: SDR family NAD(P)-dependent oxidoreductase [Candidatus Methylumidiphilus sp.]
MNTPDNKVLLGRVVLISGAGGGLGSVAAKACAEAGACVVLLDKAVNRLEKLHDDIVASGFTQPAIYPLDLEKATEDGYAELAEILDGQFGVLHGLLHSAADTGILGPLADIKAAHWGRLLQVNLSAAHGLTRALLPLMHRAGDASLIFTSNSSARLGKAYWGAYGVADIALEGMARMWAEELAGAGCVRVNVLVPGPVNSPSRRKTHPGELPGENPSPATLANRYVYLLGPASQGINGQIIEGPG